jgi:Caspase domain
MAALRPLHFAAAASVAPLIMSAVLAQSPPDATRGLAVVPAPVGPKGEIQELYTGSYALLVGVSRYDNPAWSSLQSIPGELDELADTLGKIGFDRVERVADPTGDQLRKTIRDFMKRFDRDGARLLFVFSGHGWTLDGQFGYFVPRDAPDPISDRAGFRDAALSMQQVVLWAEELFARHALFAFDSCFSGTIFRTRDRAVPRPLNPTTMKPVRQFLSAGDAGETVPAKSVFIPLFMRGIRGAADGNGDGYVTGTELGNYVQYEVWQNPAKTTPQFGKVNNPRLNEGEIVFAVPSSGAVKAAPRPRAQPADTTAAGGATMSSAPVGPGLAGGSGLAADVARRTLTERSVAWSTSGLASALTAVDVDVLDLFFKGGVEAGMIIEALGSQASDSRPIAEAFFERAKGNKAAVGWLGAVLDRGLDPNATIKGAYYKKEGLLNSAIRAGNAEAAEMLLDKGASPHAYQELWLTPSSIARFVLPFNAVIEHESLTLEEKGRIIKRYVDKGAIVPNAGTPWRFGGTSHTQALEALSKSESRAGVKLTPTSSPKAQSQPICSHASKRDRFDWCVFSSTLPTRIWTEPAKGEKIYHDFYRLETLGLMNVIDGKAYLLGIERESNGPGLAVVEVSRDARTWRVYRHMSPGAGMGLCQSDGKGPVPDKCWRRVSMTYDPGKRQMMVEDHYPYHISADSPAR